MTDQFEFGQSSEVTLEDWERRKEFIKFSAEDCKLLADLLGFSELWIDEILEELYTHFFEFREVRAFFPDAATIEYVKAQQKVYFIRLMSGDYGEEYLADRLQVGIVHQHLGLEPRWYIGAYSLFGQLLIPRLKASLEPDLADRSIQALLKLISLDIDLVISAYSFRQEEMVAGKSEEKYTALVENLPHGIYQMSPQGSYISANPALAQMLGYQTPQDLMGSIANRSQLHVDQSLAKNLADSLDEYGIVENYEVPVYQKSGEIMWVSTNSRAVFDESGTLDHYEGTVVDITAKKAAEKAREAALQDLESARQALLQSNSELQVEIDERAKSEYQARLLANEARLLSATLHATASAESFEEGLQQCIDIICKYIGWPVGHLYLAGLNGARLQPTSIWHLDDPLAFDNFRRVTEERKSAEENQRLPREGLPGRVSSSGAPVWITDVQEDANFLRNQTEDDIKVRGAFGFPVIIGTETTAVLEFFTDEPAEPDHGILELMRQIGIQISQMIERERSRETLARQAEVFFNVSEILAKPVSYREKLIDAMQMLASVAEADRVLLYVPDAEGNGLTTIVRIRRDGSSLPALRTTQGLSVKAFESGRTIVINDYESLTDQDPMAIKEGTQSVISSPLKGANGILAVCSIVSEEKDHFNPERTRLLTAIVEALGRLLENAELQDQIREELELRRQTEAQLLQRSVELEALFNISSILAAPGIYEDKLHQALVELVMVAEGLWVNLLVHDPQEPRMVVIAHARADGHSEPVVYQTTGLAIGILESGEPLVENDYVANPKSDPAAIEKGARSMIGLPIKSNNETYAVMVILSDNLGHFNQERARLLTAIVDGLAPLLENARLNQEIVAREDALHQSQKLESVGLLATGVAHEVNNPLASILGFSKLLLGQDIPEQARQDVQRIFEDADRAANIIQDLLSFARKGSSQMARVGITTALNRVLNLKAADFRDNQITVDLELEENLPDVEIDEQRLQQVYLHVLTNAQHAIAEANDKGNIFIRCERSGDSLRLSFADDGPGMTEDTLEKVFEPFYSTKPQGQGTGLGLSVCYGIIADHGGNLWAESEPGKGATFFIDLPAYERVGQEVQP